LDIKCKFDLRRSDNNTKVEIAVHQLFPKWKQFNYQGILDSCRIQLPGAYLGSSQGRRTATVAKNATVQKKG